MNPDTGHLISFGDESFKGRSRDELAQLLAEKQRHQGGGRLAETDVSCGECVGCIIEEAIAAYEAQRAARELDDEAEAEGFAYRCIPGAGGVA